MSPDGSAPLTAAERFATLPLLPADPSELIATSAGLEIATLMPEAALAGLAVVAVFVLRRLRSSGLRRTRRAGRCGAGLWLPGWSVSRLARGLTRPRIGFRARRRTGTELAAAPAVRLQIARHPFRGTMPMAVPVVESPLAAEQNQRHGHTALKHRRRARIVAVARVAAGIGIVRRRSVVAPWWI